MKKLYTKEIDYSHSPEVSTHNLGVAEGVSQDVGFTTLSATSGMESRAEWYALMVFTSGFLAALEPSFNFFSAHTASRVLSMVHIKWLSCTFCARSSMFMISALPLRFQHLKNEFDKAEIITWLSWNVYVFFKSSHKKVHLPWSWLLLVRTTVLTYEAI